ncbi:hypothetical protein D3C76_722880 [compost metagenome]
MLDGVFVRPTARSGARAVYQHVVAHSNPLVDRNYRNNTVREQPGIDLVTDQVLDTQLGKLRSGRWRHQDRALGRDGVSPCAGRCIGDLEPQDDLAPTYAHGGRPRNQPAQHLPWIIGRVGIAIAQGFGWYVHGRAVAAVSTHALPDQPDHITIGRLGKRHHRDCHVAVNCVGVQLEVMGLFYLGAG